MGLHLSKADLERHPELAAAIRAAEPEVQLLDTDKPDTVAEVTAETKRLATGCHGKAPPFQAVPKPQVEAELADTPTWQVVLLAIVLTITKGAGTWSHQGKKSRPRRKRHG